MPNGGKLIVHSVHTIIKMRRRKLFAMALCAAMTRGTDSTPALMETMAETTVAIATMAPMEMVAMEMILTMEMAVTTIRNLTAVTSKV